MTSSFSNDEAAPKPRQRSAETPTAPATTRRRASESMSIGCLAAWPFAAGPPRGVERCFIHHCAGRSSLPSSVQAVRARRWCSRRYRAWVQRPVARCSTTA